jgi:hypothetical protein
MKTVLVTSILIIFASLFAGGLWLTALTSFEDEISSAELTSLVPTEDELTAQFGSKSLTHSETRKVYLEALQWGRDTLTQRQSLNSIVDVQNRTFQCHLFRWRLRIWARKRDREWVRVAGFALLPPEFTSTLLGIRDVVVHGSLNKLFANPFHGLRSILACLVQDPGLPYCPSLDTLLERHEGNWDEVEKVCWKSNAKWN